MTVAALQDSMESKSIQSPIEINGYDFAAHPAGRLFGQPNNRILEIRLFASPAANYSKPNLHSYIFHKITFCSP